MRGDTNQYYRDFVRAMHAIGYQGYLSYELCHPLPVVDGQTVDIGYAHQNAQLAAEFMRDLIESESVPVGGKSPQPAARC
jgi:sugar phosphate isomerase/epimerase